MASATHSTAPAAPAAADIVARHDRYMTHNYARYDVAFVRGEGVKLWDAAGEAYLDLFAGFGGPLLGHCHPDLVDAVNEQANKLWHVGNLFHTEPQTRLAQAIAEHGFGGRSFFCHSGADANEAAIKLARLHGRAEPGPRGPRFKVITTLKSFHGRSFATMAATGQPAVGEGFAPLPEGFVHVPYNDLAAVEAALDDQTAGILVEPIQGEGGVRVPDDDYLPRLRSLCDEHNLLLMVDEVWTGCGRTGHAFAYQHWGVTPDVMTLAKGVGGGLAVGVACAGAKAAPLFDWRPHGRAVHATTLGGNCLAMAVGARIFEVIDRDQLIRRARTLGEHAMTRLRDFAQKHDFITDVRGKGLFVGVDLAPSDATWFNSGSEVVRRALDQRLIINATQGNTVRIAPALVITEAELDCGLDMLEAVLEG